MAGFLELDNIFPQLRLDELFHLQRHIIATDRFFCVVGGKKQLAKGVQAEPRCRNGYLIEILRFPFDIRLRRIPLGKVLALFGIGGRNFQ